MSPVPFGGGFRRDEPPRLGPRAGRDGEIEAFVVDRYLESLLAREPASIDGVPVDLAATAHRLTRDLPRHHPSFRFEEALSARLAAVAARLEAGELVSLPLPGRAVPDLDDEQVDRDDGVRAGLARPAVIGGVLTSAALSLAGAAFVAWRRSRPGDPMGRAARAVARARLV